MNKLKNEHQKLWQKIQDFQLDEPQSSFPFSHKLAKQNNWSKAFTERAIEEYRKFILLTIISPTGASPSNVVDEVWHLHLTYTKSYWEEFCSKTIGKPIHHHPSKGGEEEIEKHTSWYKETIENYIDTFNENPPTDIWPPPKEMEEQNLNLGSPNLSLNKHMIRKAALLLMLPFAFITIAYHQANPYSVSGEHFLVFYGLFLTIILFLLYSFNSHFKLSITAFANKIYPKSYNFFEAVSILFGKEKAAQAAIIDLLKKDILELKGKDFINKASLTQHEGCTNPLLLYLLETNYKAYNYEELVYYYKNQPLHDSNLINLKNIASKTPRYIIATFSIAVIPGLIRIAQGLWNDKPTSFLIFEMFLFVILFYVISTVAGIKQTIAAECKRRFAEDSIAVMDLKPVDEVLKEFVLDGLGVIKGYAEYPALKRIFPKPGRSGGDGLYMMASDSSSCGSSCSSCSSGCGGCGGD